MNDENIKDQCCQCRINFNKNDIQRLKLDSTPINLFICNSCLSNNSKQQKSIVPTFKDLELFI